MPGDQQQKQLLERLDTPPPFPHHGHTIKPGTPEHGTMEHGRLTEYRNPGRKLEH